jgi:hypothetical protein
VEVGVAFDGAVILLEPAAPRSNSAIEVVDGFEVLVDERLIDKGPETLSGLEFRAAWRLIDEPDADRRTSRRVVERALARRDRNDGRGT